MKATRDQLKSLMKELLVEILSEGLGNVQASASRPPAPGRVPISGAVREGRLPSGRRQPTFDPRLDSPVSNGRTPTDAMRNAVLESAGGNPMMADILADTARTTLPTQLSADGPMGRSGQGPAQQEQFQGDPSEIFEGGQVRDDGSSHWADLAFAGSSKKTA